MSLYKINSIIIFSTLVLVCFSFSQSYADTTSNNTNSNEIPSGEVMISSATIIGFAGFGSILAINFKPSATINHQLLCSMIIYAAILCEILLHLYVIWSAFVNDLSQYTYASIMVLTMLCVTAIVVCFGLIAVFQHGFKATASAVGHITDTTIESNTIQVKIEHQSSQ